MTITAQSADGVQHQFPDGTPAPVIDKVMKQYAAQKASAAPKPMSYADMIADVGKSAISGLGKGVAAVAGLPGDLQDLTAWGVKKLTGYDVNAQPQVSIPGVGDAGGQVPDSAMIGRAISKPTGGFHQPQTTAGKYADTIASFLPAAAGGEASLPARLATRVVLPGAASEAAGEATQGTELEPYAKVGGAILGASIPSLARGAIRSLNVVTSKAGVPLVNPSTRAAEAVAQAVRRDGGVNAALSRAQDFASAGVNNPSLADVTGNNVMRLVRMAASDPQGEGQNIALSYADRVRAGLHDNVAGHARALTPGETRSANNYAADLEKTQGDLADKQYPEPYSKPAAVTKEMVSALQGPEGRGAIGQAYADARANRNLQQMGELQDLLTVAKEQGGGSNIVTGKRQSIEQALTGLSAGSLDRVRIAMRDLGRGFAARGMNSRAGGYAARVRDIDTALDQTPGLTEARGVYRGMQSQIDAVDVGRGALARASNEYADQIANLSKISPAARTAAGVGHRQAILDAIEKPAEGGLLGTAMKTAISPQAEANLEASFGPDAAQRYSKAVPLEVGRVRKANAISPNTGSQTALREGEGDILSHIPLTKHGLVAKAIDWVRGRVSLTPAEKDEIVRLGLTETDLRALAARLPKTQSPLIAPASAGAISSLNQGNR